MVHLSSRVRRTEGRGSGSTEGLLKSRPARLYHRPRPRTSLATTNRITAPIVDARIAPTRPDARRMPSRGNSKAAISAPATPITRSPTRPKPVPRTSWPASHPATIPTNKMTARLSADKGRSFPSRPHEQTGVGQRGGSPQTMTTSLSCQPSPTLSSRPVAEPRQSSAAASAL